MSAEDVARAAIAYVREHYDESIFPPRPKGPHSQVYDGEAAAVARLICDNILREFERRLSEEEEEEDKDKDEVEVTSDLEIAVSQGLQQMRRSGAKNVSSPHLQNAFIDEARFAMGQPSQSTVSALVTKRVRLVFNVDKAPVTGTLTAVVNHPTSTYLVLDDDQNLMYPLNSIQSIEEA